MAEGFKVMNETHPELRSFKKIYRLLADQKQKRPQLYS